MKSSREIQERIDELAIEAKALYDAAKTANRAMDEEEESRFEEITDKLIPSLKNEHQKAVQVEDRVRQLTQDKVRQEKYTDLGNLVDEGYERAAAVLPVNGELSPSRKPKVLTRVAKLRAFKSDQAAYDAGMWLRAIVAREYNRDEDVEALQHCQRIGWRVTNAQTEGSGAGGGYVVPAPLSQTIIDVRERVGVARRLLNVMPMSSDTLTVAKRSGGLTVYGGGEAPSSDMTSSDKSWKQVKLVADKRYTVNQISQELTDDAIINVVDDAFAEMGYALALEEDKELIDGDGTSTYRGVTGLSAIGAGGVYTAGTGDDTWGELDATDFAATMGKLPSRFHQAMGEKSWVCSSAFYYTVMERLMIAAGGNTVLNLQSGPSNGQNADGYFWGHPVYFSDRCPTATAAATVHAYFGNFYQLGILGDRGGIRMARSDDFAFLKDLTTLKATSRYDIVCHELGDASNAGAVVALKTAS